MIKSIFWAVLSLVGVAGVFIGAIAFDAATSAGVIERRSWQAVGIFVTLFVAIKVLSVVTLITVAEAVIDVRRGFRWPRAALVLCVLFVTGCGDEGEPADFSQWAFRMVIIFLLAFGIVARIRRHRQAKIDNGSWRLPGGKRETIDMRYHGKVPTYQWYAIARNPSEQELDRARSMASSMFHEGRREFGDVELHHVPSGLLKGWWVLRVRDACRIAVALDETTNKYPLFAVGLYDMMTGASCFRNPIVNFTTLAVRDPVQVRLHP